jgi:transcriptional regulator with XRE-family HTH domain
MAEEELARRFGMLVQRLRSEKHLSQERLAELSNLHQVYVSSIERGERNVTIGTADKIAKGLGTTLSAMFLKLEQEPDDPTNRR